MEAKQSVNVINRVLQNLYSKYLEKRLNHNFLEETMMLFANEIGQKIFKNYIFIENNQITKEKNNKKIGTLIFLNGSIYIGDIINRKREGKGIMKYLDEDPYKGEICEGESKNNAKEGREIYK